MIDIATHESIQAYFDKLYYPLKSEMQQALVAEGNEIYGELIYYSGVELLNSLSLQENDHFLDIGSGFGKWIFQVFLTSPISHVTGIEINAARYEISLRIKKKLAGNFPNVFQENRGLNIINADFLEYNFEEERMPVTIAYACSTVFSQSLLLAMGTKLENMPSMRTLISFRKLSNLQNFILKKRLFLQGSWDRTPCYIYERKKIG